jgi:hypothetical protein
MAIERQSEIANPRIARFLPSDLDETQIGGVLVDPEEILRLTAQ